MELYKARRNDYDAYPPHLQWVEGYPLQYKGCCYICPKPYLQFHGYSGEKEVKGMTFGFGNFVYVDEKTLCQDTEFTDANGTKIYTNNIVDFYGQRGVVMYEYGTFGIGFEHPIDWNYIMDSREDKSYFAFNDHFVSMYEIMENDCLDKITVLGDIINTPELSQIENVEGK